MNFLIPIVALRNIIPVQQTPKPSAQVPSWVPPILSHSCLKEYTLRHITLWRGECKISLTKELKFERSYQINLPSITCSILCGSNAMTIL